MRLLIQRVSEAFVTVKGKEIAHIGPGMLILYGLNTEDTEALFPKVIDKAVNLRIFSDGEHDINASIQDIGGEILLVSQFTLYADTKKGRRPGFSKAMEPEKARILSNIFVQEFKKSYDKTQTGEFQAMMNVSLVNDGPVTIMIDTDEWR